MARVTGSSSPALATRRWSSNAIWMRSGWLRGSIYWVLLVSGRFSVSKPLSQIQRSTLCLLQGLSPRPSLGGFGLSRETFLDQFTVAEVRNAAARILDVARDSGATFEWGQRGGVSVRGHCSRWEQPITVAWLYSPSMKGSGWMRTRDFTFGVAILEYDPAPDEELRSVLQKWADTFRDDSFTADVSSQGVTAWSVAHDSAPIHIDLLESRLSGVLSELKSL